MHESLRFPGAWTLALTAAGLALALQAPAARAQLDEPHGYIEPCTIANYQEMHTECELCEVPKSDAEACSRRLQPGGYEKKCRTRGEPSAWAEVWCVDLQRAPKASAPDAKSRPVLAGIIALLLAGGFWLWRSAKSSEGKPR